MDRLSGRERLQPDPQRPSHLGRAWLQTGDPPPLRPPEAPVDVGRPELCTRRIGRGARRLHDAGRLQRPAAHGRPRRAPHRFDCDKVTLLWDGLPSHRSGAVKRFIASERHSLVVNRFLPPSMTSTQSSRSRVAQGTGARQHHRRDRHRTERRLGVERSTPLFITGPARQCPSDVSRGSGVNFRYRSLQESKAADPSSITAEKTR